MAVKAKGPGPQPYTVVNAPNGAWHVYANGRRVFIPAKVGPGRPVGVIHPAAPSMAPAGVKMTPTAVAPTAIPAQPGPAATPAAAAPAASTPGAPANPYAPDATYYATDAQLKFKADQAKAGLDQEGAYDKTDLAEALRRLLERQPKDQQAAKEAANRQGLLYSGHLGEQLGDINTDYVRQQGDAQQAYDRREAARAAARRAIEAGLPIDEAAAWAESVDRSTLRDVGAADAGALPAASGAPASTTATVTAPKIAQGAMAAPRKPRKPAKRKNFRRIA